MLRWEGYAREVVRNIQELRKKSGFEISDRIQTTVQSGPSLRADVAGVRRRDRAGDAVDCFEQGAPAAGAFTANLSLDGQEVVVGVRKA